MDFFGGPLGVPRGMGPHGVPRGMGLKDLGPRGMGLKDPWASRTRGPLGDQGGLPGGPIYRYHYLKHIFFLIYVEF